MVIKPGPKFNMSLKIKLNSSAAMDMSMLNLAVRLLFHVLPLKGWRAIVEPFAEPSIEGSGFCSSKSWVDLAKGTILSP